MIMRRYVTLSLLLPYLIIVFIYFVLLSDKSHIANIVFDVEAIE